MKLTGVKRLFEQVTIKQLQQNLVLMQADEIEIPKKWFMELLDTIEAQQQDIQSYKLTIDMLQEEISSLLELVRKRG